MTIIGLSGTHITSPCINQYSIHMIWRPNYYHKAGHPAPIVVHREELEDGDYHIDDC